jgi:trans-aconitate 2-methyltransferase
MWDPVQYEAYADQRGRPFFELVGRVRAARPAFVVDLGCGTGRLTATLAHRWPDAMIEGVDSSAEMIEAARTALAAGGARRLRFTVGDLAGWAPTRPVDVIVSNAALQWVPRHEELLARWVDALAPGGWLAFQVPGNFHEPSHLALRELCGSARWRPRLGGVPLGRPVAEPDDYLDRLTRLGCAVDAWETTYLHVLEGRDPVLEWVKGTALRPVLAALDSEEAAARFLAEYGARLRAAYPPRAYGTVLPFRRIFVVARRPEDR